VVYDNDRVRVRELWSEVVSLSIASVRADLVVSPWVRHRSMVEGLLPFLGWWVGIAGLFRRWKLLCSSQCTMAWLAGEVRAVWGRGPCHHGWCALRSPIIRQFAGMLSERRRAASGSDLPGEYRLKMVKLVVCCSCCSVMVVPRKESWAVKVVVAQSPGSWRMYVAYLSFVGVGRKRFKFGRSGGFPCLSRHGSWIRQIRFSVFLAKSRSVEIVVAWPLAQFNSCTDPTACEGILYVYFRHGGISRVGCGIRVRVVVEGSDFDSLRAVGVAGLVGGLAVGAADRQVGAGWAFLAGRNGAGVVFSLVGFRAEGAAGGVPAQGCRVSVALAVAVLGASPLRDIVVELAFTVADREVVSSDVGHLDTAGEGHDDRGG